MKIFPTQISKDQSRDTGMAMVLLLLIAYWATRRSAYWATKREFFLAAAAVIHVVNMIVPQVFRPTAQVWLGLSHAIGTVTSKFLLSLVFFLVVTPISAIRKIMKKDSLKLLAFKAGRGTTMLERNHTFVAQDLDKPY
jgi:hypothetical protein